MKAEDLLNEISQSLGFGDWQTVVLNCHHTVIRDIAIAAVNKALLQCNVSGQGEQLGGITMEPIKSNEVRIGNLVQDRNGVVMRVVSIHEDGPIYCDFKGNKEGMWEFKDKYPCYAIPLTEEILLKMGFEKLSEVVWHVEYRIDSQYTIIYYKEDKYFKLFNTFSSLVKVKYLHELQNLIFALTGEELVIK